MSIKREVATSGTEDQKGRNASRESEANEAQTGAMIETGSARGNERTRDIFELARRIYASEKTSRRSSKV
ncbi:MAG: hypothetical protein ABJA02_02665 [Acidobacteriota bacterium]